MIKDWDKFSIDELLVVPQYLNTNKLLKILKRLLENINKNRSGFPDLIIYKEKELLFVEVKSKNDSLSENQIEWKSYFESIDITYILFLVNHTQKQIKNIKNKIAGNDKIVKVTFGYSTSKYREEAIEFMEKQDSFFTEGEGKEKTYGAYFKIKEIEKLYKILDLISRWKTSKFVVEGKEVTAKELRNSLWCYRKKNKINAPIDYCKTDEYTNEINKFHCKQVKIDSKRWTEYGYVDTKNGEWIFNKNDLNELANDIINNLKFCPLFKPEKVRKFINNLPERVDPKEDENWGYISADKNYWFYHNGEWVSGWIDKEFPGYSSMIGIKKISKEEKENALGHKTLTKEINIDIQNKQKKEKSGCFIATAVYEDYNSPEVLKLRKYRDEKMKYTILGKLFINTYYTISPPIAKVIKNNKFLKKLIRPILDKIVSIIDN